MAHNKTFGFIVHLKEYGASLGYNLVDLTWERSMTLFFKLTFKDHHSMTIQNDSLLLGLGRMDYKT